MADIAHRLAELGDNSAGPYLIEREQPEGSFRLSDASGKLLDRVPYPVLHSHGAIWR